MGFSVNTSRSSEASEHGLLARAKELGALTRHAVDLDLQPVVGEHAVGLFVADHLQRDEPVEGGLEYPALPLLVVVREELAVGVRARAAKGIFGALGFGMVRRKVATEFA